MQVSLKDMADSQPALLSGFYVNVHIALRIDHDGFSHRREQVRGVGQTAQVKLLEVDASCFLRPRDCGNRVQPQRYRFFFRPGGFSVATGKQQFR